MNIQDTDDQNRSNADHPYRTGVDLLINSRWFELTQQQRALQDPIHTNFVHNTYKGEHLTLDSIKSNFKLLSTTDLGSIHWLLAACLVTTNRERRSIIHTRSIQYAAFTEQVVIRWETAYRPSTWKNAPDPSLQHIAKRDPCFYEYFVSGCNGYIVDNIQKDLHIVNGIQVKYHSVKLDCETEDWLEDELSAARPGDVLTLPERPLAVNVEITMENASTPVSILSALRKLALNNHSDQTSGKKGTTKVLIPIVQLKSEHWDDGDTPVYGSHLFGPSKIRLGRTFPLEPAFAITTHKSEGQTLDRVIIALSECGVSKCNFSYEQLHVAFSRVRKSDHVRLLLAGDNEMQQWMSVVYVRNLRQHPSIRFFFCGFRDPSTTEDPNEGWTTNAWCPQRANSEFLKLFARGDI